MAMVAFGFAACQTDPQDLDVTSGGEQTTTISVVLPDDAITRAGGTNSASGGLTNTKGETVRVILQVYDENGKASKERLVEYLHEGELTANFDVRLVPNRNYTFVAWADQVKGEADVDLYYDTQNLEAVTIKDGTWNAMDESRDAYTATKLIEDFNSSKSIELTLKRPFAKLRVVTTDMAALNNLGIEPTTATVAYTTDHYTTFNAKAGYAINKNNSGVEHKNYTIASYGENWAEGADMTLYTDYFFAAEDEEVVNFTFDVFDYNGKLIKDDAFTTDIPVKRNHLTTIKGNVLTESDNITVTIDERFDGYNTFVDSAAIAQEALDNAAANTTIYLEPGVNYGVLYLRPAGAPTKEVDWIGNNYRYETYTLFENLTIVGAEGATVDAIEIEGGTYYNTAHSQSDKYPIMLSLIELKNVVIDGVTFTGKGGYDPQGHGNAINLSGSNIKVDGLTLKNCVLNNNDNNARLIYKTESTTHVHTYAYNGETYTFTPSLKNITITDCTLNGGYMGLELRETENVTITNNEFRVGDRNILLPVNSGCTYSGNVTITGNVSYDAKERFVRMDGAGDAVVVIKDNTIIDYNGADADFIKVTNGNNVTIENNYLVDSPIADYDAFIAKISDDTWYDDTATDLIIEDVADYAAFVEVASSGNDFDGKTIKLANDIDLYFKDITAMADGDPVTFRPIGDTQYGPEPFRGTFDGQGHTIKNLYQNGWDLGYQWGVYGSYGLFGELEGATVKNVVIEGSESYIEGGDVSFIAGSATGDCVFENITIKSGVAATYNNGCGGIIGWSGAGNYTFKNITLGEDVVLGGLWGSFDSSIGGIVGQAEPGATYNFENVTINCRIDAYNDCTASYDYYNYRMCGMIIGRCEETTTINGTNYPDLSKYNMTFNNVVVNYGDWMNYHYCRKSGERAVRIEPGYSYGGAEGRDHSGDNAHCMMCIPFDQLIGGDQYAVKGLPAVDGVTVNYPASYRREVATAATLTDALNKGLSVVLENDIDFGSTQLAIAGENQVVDLGGHALTTANNWGGISLKNGATIKNGTITHSGNTAAIKAFNGSSVENVTINATCSTADKTVTGIAVQQGANVESIKNVTINGVSQGIEVGYQATVGLIENAVVNELNNGTAEGIGLVINGGKVGLAKNCTFIGETYGITLHLKGVFAVGLDLENCEVKGNTHDLYTWDEKGISNTSGSLRLTYDDATEQKSGADFIVTDFEEECVNVVRILKK